MKPVAVVGAGFSGLTLAYELVKLGLSVEIFEKQSAIGGLISTRETPFGMVETAANALFATAEVEHLFQDLKIEFAKAKPERKNRYIFWEKPRRWPLSIGSSFKLFKLFLAKVFSSKSIRPRPQESVSQWAQRLVGKEFETKLMAPALNGIYAGDPKKLSAALVLARILRPSKKGRGEHRGSIAPQDGMGALMEALRARLIEKGVSFHSDQEFQISAGPVNPTVLCTSVGSAENILRPQFSKIADLLSRCESLPLISITAFFEPHPKDLQGFGCLFPKEQNFSALGVLFNANIFEGRSQKRSETWIFGGALNSKVTQLSDAQLRALLFEDRKRLTRQTRDPLGIYITRWPKALPHYTVEWEETLKQIQPPEPIYLHGNYLGSIGLTLIYERSQELAQQIKERHGHE